MSNRYTQLFLLPQNLYSEGAPILIEAGALLNDSQTNKILAQLKYKNLQEKHIKAMNVRIQPMDVLGNPLGDAISFQYLDLSVNCGEVFGSQTPINLPDNTTRAFSVKVCSVVFDDNSVWESADALWDKLGEPIRFNNGANKELQKQYQSLYGTSASYQLQEMKDLWQCVCGAIHKNTTSTCNICHNSLTDLRRFDMDALKEACAQRLDATAKADASKRKKKRTLAIVMSSVVAIVVAIALLWNPVIQPSIKYNKAISLLDTDEYEAARNIFLSMPNYKDSSTYLENFVVLYETMKYEDGYTDLYEYDNMGNLTKEIVIYPDGEINRTNSYEYDSMGNLIKEIHATSNYEVEYNYSYEYDSTGNIVKKIELIDSEINRTFSYEYDNTGNLINETIIFSRGDIATYSYEYDNTGNLIKEIFVDILGTIETNSYEYDSKGNIIKKICEVPDYETQDTYSYEYDNTGNLVKENLVDIDGKIEHSISYEYDNTGYLVRETREFLSGTIYFYEYFNPRVFYKPKS